MIWNVNLLTLKNETVWQMNFTAEVKRHQDRYGEFRFNREMSTLDIVQTVLKELSPYISEGETRHMFSQLPKEIKQMAEECIN
jgi:uncharacterized protein (DUF2267 family)